eukprot:g13991.t1
MYPKARSLPRFAAVVLLVAAAMMMRLDTAAAQDDPCIPVDEICKADEVCRGCQEVVGTNVDGFEECIRYYGFEEDVCINQSAQACCQDVASPDDCLANEAYTNFYECRLSLDVPGGECTVLNCDAVDATKPTSLTDDDATASPTPAAAGDDDPAATTSPTPAVVDDDDEEASVAENSAGRLAPSFLASITGGKAGFLLTAGLPGWVVLAAAFF